MPVNGCSSDPPRRRARSTTPLRTREPLNQMVMQIINRVVNPTALVEFHASGLYDLGPGGITMPHREPTIRSRELGDGLRQAMQQAGLSGKQAAQMLDVTPSYVSMLLAGKRAAREVDIAAFLGVCRVKGA